MSSLPAVSGLPHSIRFAVSVTAIAVFDTPVATARAELKIDLAVLPPMIEQRPGLAEDGIGRGERQARDVLIHARAFAGLAIIHIHFLSRRVGADDVEVLARSE